MVSVPLNTTTPRTGDALARKTLVAVGVGGATVGLIALATRPRVSPVRQARQDLVRELSSERRSCKKLDGLVDVLLASKEPFSEAQHLGGGAWQVVYTRGPLLREHAYEGIGWLLDGKALQELQPLGHRLVNRAQLGPWPELFITTEGTYDLQGEGSQMPRTLSTSVTKGTLHCWGRKLPLPVRGSGTLSLAYADDSLRVFQAKGGGLTVQVREDRLAALLLAK